MILSGVISQHLFQSLIITYIYRLNLKILYSTYRALNYGGIGVTIAHEIMHSIDATGARFNKHGVITNWLSRESRNEYSIRVECIREQYSNYYVMNDDVQEQV